MTNLFGALLHGFGVIVKGMWCGKWEHTNFWLDKWGSSNTPFISVATKSFMEITLNGNDIVDATGNWKYNFSFRIFL